MRGKTIFKLALLALLALCLLLCLYPRSALSLAKPSETIDQCAIVIDHGTTSHGADVDLPQLLELLDSTRVYWAGRYRTITFPADGSPIYRRFLTAENGTVTTLVVPTRELYTNEFRYRVYGESNPVYNWLYETAIPRR